MQASPTQPFLLVTGAMRSGTTLMGELLYSRADGIPRHDELSFDNDSGRALRTFLQTARKADGYAAGAPFKRTPVTQALVRELASQLGTSAPDSLDEARDRIRAEILAIAPAYRPRMIGAKVTHVMAEFDALASLFKSRMIVLVRDPRDVFSSHRVRISNRPKTDPYLICLTLLNYAAFLQVRQHDDRIMAIRYETLVSEPAATVRAALDHAGLDPAGYRWDLLEANQVASNSSYLEGRGKAFHPTAGISAGSVGAYRSRMSDREIIMVEAATQPLLDAFGYRLESTEAQRAQMYPELVALGRRARAFGLSTSRLKALPAWRDNPPRQVG